MTGEFVGKGRGGKLLRLRLDWTGDQVDAVALRGDFFAHPEDGFEAAEAALAGIPVAALGATFGTELARHGVRVFGLEPGDLDDAAAAIMARAAGEGAP